MKLSNGYTVNTIPDFSNIPSEQKERCRQWIDALRSGEYRQQTGALKVPEGFCCLGVACDVARKNGFGKWREFKKVSVYADETGESNVVLTKGVQDFFGILGPDGFRITLSPPGLEDSRTWRLVDLNDGKIASFTEISNIIEIAINGGLNVASVS